MTNTDPEDDMTLPTFPPTPYGEESVFAGTSSVVELGVSSGAIRSIADQTSSLDGLPLDDLSSLWSWEDFAAVGYLVYLDSALR